MTPRNAQPARDLSAASGWRKSTYSTESGSCVEVAQTPCGAVAIRDTTDRPGPALSIAPSAWRSFTARIQAEH